MLHYVKLVTMTIACEKKNTSKKSSTGVKKRVRSRNWCFTIFDSTWNGQSVWDSNMGIIRYIGWAVERAPTTDKTHMQGWLQTINPKDFSVVQSMLGCGAHIEVCRGNEHQNQTYISKENNPTTFGTFVSQGHRSDLEDVKKTIDLGGTMMDVAQNHFGDYVRYHTGFEKYKKLVQQKNTRDFRTVKVSIYAGSTGTGKTRSAMEHNDVFKISGSELQWWDGYEGEKRLVIDEYDNQIPCTKLLGILDGYQYRLPIKGGFTYAAWNEVIITMNCGLIHPNAKKEHLQALERRINDIRIFGDPDWDTKCL